MELFLNKKGHDLKFSVVQHTIECFLIEDDVDDQEIFSMALKAVNENIVCVFSSNGIDGLNKLKEDITYVPDYIFIDVNMPKMNGLQCLEEIRKLDHLQNVTIIMFSTSTDARIIEKSMASGANDFLVKPAGYNLLIETLAKIFAG